MPEEEETKITWPEGMSAEQREALTDLVRTFDQAATDFEKDQSVIFASEQERRGILYGAVARWGRSWSKPGRCMYEGCTKTSIARSHTISLGASIEQIAEDGHVLTPRFGPDGMRLVRIGKREASTFPGFCDEHEALFAEFENRGTLTADRHFQLQVFRTLCREIYAKRHEQTKLDEILTSYRGLRDGYMQRSMASTEVKRSSSERVKITFEGDPREHRLVDLMSSGKQDLAELGALYGAVLDDLRTNDSKVVIQIRHFNLQMPVCLSGLGVLNYEEAGADKRCLACLAVLPEAQGTKILIAVAPEHAEVAALHLNDTTSPAVLARIESWMLHGSDHWFIRPSSWALIPAARQSAILKRIPEPGSLIEDPPFSVLDEARSVIVAGLATAISAGEFSPEDEPRARQLLAREKAKLEVGDA